MSLFGKLVFVAGLPFETRDLRQRMDAIVVFGTPLRQDGQLSLAGQERVAEGVRLWKQGVAPLLAFTGGAAHGAAEAPAMAARARELGVDDDALIVEDQSLTTTENARFSATLLRAKGVQRVWVVSQPFHLRRARRLLRQQGFTAKAHSTADSVQYQRPDLAWRWVAREYLAWIAHFCSSKH